MRPIPLYKIHFKFIFFDHWIFRLKRAVSKKFKQINSTFQFNSPVHTSIVDFNYSITWLFPGYFKLLQ